mgnify:FL=1
MRIVLQRVSRASVIVGGRTIAAIGAGLVALVGIACDDTTADVDALAAKTVALRIFDDPDGFRAVGEVGGSVLVVSQFTLLADTRRGRRPSWAGAAPADVAHPLVARYAQQIASAGVPVAEGDFGAHMAVDLVNDGPVTIWLEK